MPKHTLEQLAGLQQQLQDFSFDDEVSDMDSVSLASRNTKDTSVCSSPHINRTQKVVGVQLAREKTPIFATTLMLEQHELNRESRLVQEPLKLRQKASMLSERLVNSALVLECLNDMVAQENAHIEAAISDVTNELATSIGMNSVTIAKKSLYPFRT